MDYREAMDVLRSWHGQSVIVVAFVEPGVSLHPFAGDLEIEDPGHGMVRGAVVDDGGTPTRIAFPSGTFHEASWVPGHEDRGLSIIQGATRVDVFVDD
jgi:hypothetical protein